MARKYRERELSETGQNLITAKDNVGTEKGFNPKEKDYNYKLWILIISVMNVVTFILCIMTGVFMAGEERMNLMDEDLCVRCTDLRIHEDDELRNIQEYRDGTCCAKPDYQQDFIHAYTDVWFRRKRHEENLPYKECRDNVKETVTPAIKLIRAYKSPKEANGMRIHWDDTAFNRDAQTLLYYHGKVEVKKAGQYFIYLQIDFLCDAMKRLNSSSTSYNVMQVARLRKRVTQEEVIIKSSTTPPDCYNDQGPANYTSHAGTSLYLSEGDYVYAKVFYWDTLRNHSSNSFFGMHKVE